MGKERQGKIQRNTPKYAITREAKTLGMESMSGPVQTPQRKSECRHLY